VVTIDATEVIKENGGAVHCATMTVAKSAWGWRAVAVGPERTTDQRSWWRCSSRWK
jgi:hypothetical protein